MKRRLLAFLLAFVMTFSLVPVNTFAAEADAAVHYTNITTESGENVTVEYVETVVGEAAWGQSINTPYYHVTIPEGTEKVLLTYPESVNLVLSGDDGAVFFYRNTYPGQSTIDLGGALTVATNDDGSKTVTIPVENFMLSAAGSVAVGMAYYVDEENRSAAEFFDFTYAALTHAVTLTSGEGYTLTGEATVEDGKDYSFTVTIADDYEMEDNFVVKANGETLTAGESGSYTVENVTADLTITVEGVVKKQAASHSVTLTSGGGYTLKGETTVADGADYTFSLKFDNYYGAGNGFAVKANGTALTAGEDGTYTVKNVTADLTITVEGVARLYKVFLPHGWSRQFTMSACDGYADPSTDPKIAKGGDYKFKVTPNEGFAVRDNNYDVSFSGAGTVSVEVKDGYAVVTLTDIFSNGDVRIQGVKEIITVTLPKGEGFTAAAAEGTKTPVLKGDSYSFTVTVAEGYEKTDDFAVKANGEALTAGESGSYTVENVTADLTITVEGVTEAVQKTAGLSVLKFGDTSTEAKAQMFQLIPAFDPAVKEYTVLVPDNSNMFYAWATKADDRSSSTTITAKWVNLNVDTEKTQALTSGKASGQNLAGFAPTGTKVNTMTVTVVDGDFKDEYKLTSVRVAPSLTALSLDGIRFAERFSATKTAYTATTAAESVTVAATPRDESYTVTVNGGSDTTVPLNLGENKINVVVTNPGGYTNTYTITVTRLASIEVGFTVDPADAKVTVWDSNKDRIAPTDGKYSVMADAEYTYLVQSDGYVSQKSSFKFSESSTVDITLAVATENPNLDRSITAEWGNFRNGKASIKATWTSMSTGEASNTTLISGSSTGKNLSGFNIASAESNTLTITVTDDGSTDVYTVKTVRIAPSLTKLALDGVKVNETFSATKKTYTAMTTKDSVTVLATPRGEDYTVTYNGETSNVIPLSTGENKIEIVVTNKDGYTSSYTITVTKADHAVTIPTDESYLVTGKEAVMDGADYTFKVEVDYRYEAGEDFAVKVNGETVTGEKGVYTVKNVTTDLVITVEGATKKVLKPVTVYFSFSHDDTFESCEQSGQTVALKKVTVPYFDLALYGLEDFYFASEDYGPASGDPTGGPGSALDPGTKEFAYGKITMLHLFLYATEVYYLGIDPADAGKGYLADNGIMGTDIFSYSGSTGSIFLQNIWKYDLNLNYYLNYEYPLASAGWGSTCDQILLREGDIVTLGHFSDWSFFNDTTSIFNYIVADKTDPVQGDKIKLELYHAGADMYGTYNTAHTLIDYSPSVYCTPVNDIVSGDVTTWQYVGNAEADGSLVVDTSKLAPGEYIFALAGQPGKENPGAICSTPGGIRLTIHEKPVVKGDINGDGVIDSTDVMALFNAINSGDDLDATVADVNGDGVIDARDVMALYNIIKSDN